MKMLHAPKYNLDDSFDPASFSILLPYTFVAVLSTFHPYFLKKDCVYEWQIESERLIEQKQPSVTGSWLTHLPRYDSLLLTQKPIDKTREVLIWKFLCSYVKCSKFIVGLVYLFPIWTNILLSMILLAHHNYIIKTFNMKSNWPCSYCYSQAMSLTLALLVFKKKVISWKENLTHCSSWKKVRENCW